MLLLKKDWPGQSDRTRDGQSDRKLVSKARPTIAAQRARSMAHSRVVVMQREYLDQFRPIGW